MSEVTIEQLQLGGKGHTKLVCERCGKPISYIMVVNVIYVLDVMEQ